MPRAKKEKPNADGYYRVQRVVGHKTDGTPIVKNFRSKISKTDAKAKAEGFLTKVEYDDVTFEAWANKWLWDYKEPFIRETSFEYTYRAIVKNHLIPYFGSFKLKDITADMVQTFFCSKRAFSKSAVSKMRLCLTQMYNCAIANRIISYNPCASVKALSNKTKKDSDVYTSEEAERIISLTYIHRFGLYVYILLKMGLRVSELCGLKWEDIDFNKKTMTISRACTDLNGKAVIVPPKSEKSLRTIPIPESLFQELQAERKKGFIIATKEGKPISPRTFTRRRYNMFFEELGIRKLSPKQMRHTCGTLLYEKCHDIYAVKSFLGHSDIGVTSNTYVHPNPQDLAKQLFDENK